MSFLSFMLKNLARRRLRSLLTGAAVAVAVATTVAMLGLADDFTTSILEGFKVEKTDIVITPKGSLMELNASMDQSIADRVLKLDGVQAVSPGLIETVSYNLNDNVVPLLLNGWKNDSFSFDDLILIGGRRLQSADKRGVMLGKNLAESTNKKVGESIEIQEQDFEVVGVFESGSLIKDGSAVLLLEELQDLMGRDASVTGFSVRVLPAVKEEDQGIRRVCGLIQQLTGDDGDSLKLAATPTEEFVRGNTQLQLSKAMAWMVSLIALLVGTIGMLNTMAMSVLERTREISVLRAIGWPRRRVVAMVLGEAVMLSVLGALLGTIGAVVMSRLLAMLPQAKGLLAGNIAPWVIVSGLAISALVGLIGAAYPAWRATRLLPSEGLRYE
jgi:putative ABC transport system permease protein